MAIARYFSLPVCLPDGFSVQLSRGDTNEVKSTYSLVQSHTWSDEITKSRQTAVFRIYSIEIVFQKYY